LNTANVTLKGYNTFDNNGTRGLEIETKGAITISKADASGNGGSGVFLNNDYAGATAGITLGSSRYYSSINGNGGIDPGLDIRTRGTISLTNVSVSDNENGPGASLNNTNAAKPRAVTITDGNFYNNFETGLLLLNINGPITLRGVSAGYNGDGSPNDAYGIFVLNHTGGNVVVTSSKWQGSQFDGNKNTGLWIDTTGMVTLSNLEASYNGRYGGFGHGVYIDADGNVSVSNKRSDQLTTFSGNNLNGLEIISLGTISVTNGVEANDNGSYGILLNNTNFSGSKTITANKLTTNGNGDTGLIVYGTGLVNLANLKSCNNTINGVYVHDSAGRTGNVTLTGTNLMTGNHYRGLVIYTTKKVSVSGVTANLNEESGIEIWNSTGVTVRNSTANQNKNGLYIHANGNVVVDKVKSFGNSASGSYIYSYGFNVTLQNSAFIGNQMYGIEIEDLGAGVPTLKNTLYAGNGTQDLVIH
jgi:parallel beta-helix repeat protein